MLFRVLADLTVVVHLAFILYAALGGLAVLRCPRIAWIHVPAAIWAGAEAAYRPPTCSSAAASARANLLGAG